MTNNKQQRTAIELADLLVREIGYYCEENGIDTALGFELAKSIRRENDLVATYVNLGRNGYADWISDIIINHFEEEKEESVEMKKECTLVMRKAYRVFYSMCVMAESEDEARYIAHEYSCDGENYGVRELPVTDEGLVWLMKLDAMLYETYPNYDEKQADYRRKYTARFGVNPSDKDWDDLMSVVELYGESELEERGIKA